MNATHVDRPHYSHWLTLADDYFLAELLKRRPDTAIPSPPDFKTLSSRLQLVSSLRRGMDRLNNRQLAVLSVVVLPTFLAIPASRRPDSTAPDCKTSSSKTSSSKTSSSKTVSSNARGSSLSSEVSASVSVAALIERLEMHPEFDATPKEELFADLRELIQTGFLWTPQMSITREDTQLTERNPHEPTPGHPTKTPKESKARRKKLPSESLSRSADLERSLIYINLTSDTRLDPVKNTSEALASLPHSPLRRCTNYSFADLKKEVAKLSPPQRHVLQTLLNTSHVGNTKEAGPHADPDSPISQLLKKGLLLHLSSHAVELPADLTAVLRDEPEPRPEIISQPIPTSNPLSQQAIDQAVAGHILEFLHHVARLAEELDQRPLAHLRSGGIGVRDTRRLGKATGLPTSIIDDLLEFLFAANLIARGIPQSGNIAPLDDHGDEVWALTPLADTFRSLPQDQQWELLLSGWWHSYRRLIPAGSTRPDGTVVHPLDNSAGSRHIPLERQKVLTALTALPPGTVFTDVDVQQQLMWAYPQWSVPRDTARVNYFVHQASTLGILAMGGVTSVGHTLLQMRLTTGETEGSPSTLTETHREERELHNTIKSTLPSPIKHVILPGDLTMVAPGPLESPVADLAQRIADIESSGAATTYQISEQSLRRALDSGLTASEIQAFFTNHSQTPVPQALTYLIADTARRHGLLRAGVARSFLRCDDPATLAQALTSPKTSHCGLRLLAPTVAISTASLSDLLSALRDGGFSPAAEDAFGNDIEVPPRRPRIILGKEHPAEQTLGDPRTRRGTRLSPERRQDIVSALRASEFVDKHSHPGEHIEEEDHASGLEAIGFIKEAVRNHRNIILEYVDSRGTVSQRIVQPLSISGGHLDAVDTSASTAVRFLLHRISQVRLQH